MKSPEYVYTVTSIYRGLLDGGRSADRAEKRRLSQVFSRGGFTDGYYRGNKFEPMTGVRSERDKEKTKELSPMSFEPRRVSVRAEVEMRLGKPSRMTLIHGERRVSVLGAVPTEAINSPLSQEAVKARLSKMGATMLSLSPENILLSLDEGINLSPSAINALRRDAAAALENCRRETVKVEYLPEKSTRVGGEPMKTAQFLSNQRFAELSSSSPEAVDFFDICFLPIEDFSGNAEGVYIPPVVTDTELPEVERLLAVARELGARYALVGNIGHIALAERAGLTPIGDFRLNITNSAARAEYAELGIKYAVLSPELTLPMARDIVGGEIVYGRVPLMLTERCFIKENFGCAECGHAAFEDRTGVRFPLMREFGHRNLILNSRPTYMGDRKGELSAAGVSHIHFLFTNESNEDMARAVSAYRRGESLPFEVRRIGKR